MSEALLVLLGGRFAGVLERSGPGEDPSFTYDVEYADGNNVPLSARIPLQRTRFAPAKVVPYLAGLLPEDEATRQRWARAAGADSPDDWFALLRHMGLDCPGAVQFCRPDDLAALEGAGEYVECSEADIADRLRRLADDSASWAMPEEHWSLAGQQEKFTLAHIGGRWFTSTGSAASTHIIKPGIRALKHQAFIEYATQTAASLSGVAATETKFVAFEDQWAVVSTRYDRRYANGEVYRVHQEDFCQAVGRMPNRKYESNGGPTLADMAGIIERHVHDQPAGRSALGDFAAINVIAGAPDGHSKNISLLHGPEALRVAPLYDLATGLTYDRSEVERTAAVSIGGDRHYSRIRRKQWEKGARLLKLDSERYVERVASLASAFPLAYTTVLILAAQDGVPGAAEVAERSLDTVAEHCRGILDRLG